MTMTLVTFLITFGLIMIANDVPKLASICTILLDNFQALSELYKKKTMMCTNKLKLSYFIPMCSTKYTSLNLNTRNDLKLWIFV